MLWILQAAMANHVPGLVEVSDELCLDSAVSARVDENREQEVLETSHAHAAVRLEELGKTPLEYVKEAVPVPEVQDLS
jgi:hypothetical protein